jgi:hypothetical protein
LIVLPEQPSRRAVVTAFSVIPVIGALPAGATAGAVGPRDRPGDRAGRRFRFFTGHEAAVIEDAAARLVPGPRDDPAEAGHPGAREAGVVWYLDAMLSALDHARPEVFAGGPWSNRHARGPDLMAHFTPLTPVQRIAWKQRLAGWQRQYRAGVARFDMLAGGDFTAIKPAEQDQILAGPDAAAFTGLLFSHTIEAMYANPEYGGNKNLAGWREIRFPGDIQPRGYTRHEVERSDGRDPVQVTGVVADVLKLFGGQGGTAALARALAARRGGR